MDFLFTFAVTTIGNWWYGVGDAINRASCTGRGNVDFCKGCFAKVFLLTKGHPFFALYATNDRLETR